MGAFTEGASAGELLSFFRLIRVFCPVMGMEDRDWYESSWKSSDRGDRGDMFGYHTGPKKPFLSLRLSALRNCTLF